MFLQSIASSKGPAANRAPISPLTPMDGRFVTLHIMFSREPFATGRLGADEGSLLVGVVGPQVRTHVEQPSEQAAAPREGASESLCWIGLTFTMVHLVCGCGPLELLDGPGNTGSSRS